jgi:hypothetical protein
MLFLRASIAAQPANVRCVHPFSKAGSYAIVGQKFIERCSQLISSVSQGEFFNGHRHGQASSSENVVTDV